MSLPRFLDRAIDAAAPLLANADRAAVRARLQGTSVGLAAGERATSGLGRAGFLLAANLAARLYPRIGIEGPTELVREAGAEIQLINPRAVVASGLGGSAATLGYETTVGGRSTVSVFAREWNVYVNDPDAAHRRDTHASAPAALLAGVLGIAEIFRLVFADELPPRTRRRPQTSAFNIVTLGEPRFGLPVPSDTAVDAIRLVGAGAIGQSTAHALALAGARGTMLVVDHEDVSLSNLQRYVLTRDSDVGAFKAELLQERLADSKLEVVPDRSEWHAGLGDRFKPTLVALDTPDARIGVQASLPGPIYNAWTQPADVGWSRHERFGDEPCLACLYWPRQPRASRHVQIAEAFGIDPLRALAYLVHRGIPIGLPLPPGAIPSVPDLEPPPDAALWHTTPLADDIAAAAGVPVVELDTWRGRPLADVYQDGICGGALLHLDVGEAPREVLVPLAHQSAFAGIMLASEVLVAHVPELKAARPPSTEGRFDVLAGLPQVLARPRKRTEGCLCGDSVFLEIYARKFHECAPKEDSPGAQGLEVD